MLIVVNTKKYTSLKTKNNIKVYLTKAASNKLFISFKMSFKNQTKNPNSRRLQVQTSVLFTHIYNRKNKRNLHLKLVVTSCSSFMMGHFKYIHAIERYRCEALQSTNDVHEVKFDKH